MNPCGENPSAGMERHFQSTVFYQSQWGNAAGALRKRRGKPPPEWVVPTLKLDGVISFCCVIHPPVHQFMVKDSIKVFQEKKTNFLRR